MPRQLTEAEREAIERGERGRGYKTPEQLAERRKLMDRVARRAKQRASDFSEPIDSTHDEVSRHTNPHFTITHNDFPCSSCGRGMMICTESVSATPPEEHKKVWKCDHCRHTLTGHYTTYVIPEEPGR